MSNTKNPNKRRKKRKRRGDEAAGYGASPSSAAFDRRVFPILLAAAARSNRRTQHGSNSTVAHLMRRALSYSPPLLHPLPDSLVALLPLLLTSKYRASPTLLPLLDDLTRANSIAMQL
ncbi:hypothetical protein E2562_004188 [Oryza meyeriana var. granulata]|uniref:Uncharacterized protein n=1 Tax=Oryza meyeriana var. granulata TaxID=110450 RepID=A0A6G1BRR0_9ORYZ|nr:hypothetical protein E2562_004188 [Oryza meyeriana var. granulata]